MAINIGDIIGILQDNLKLRKTVISISQYSATKWAKDLRIPRGGKTVIYTGGMNQLMPYTDIAVKYIEKYKNSRLTTFSGMARKINKTINLAGLMTTFLRLKEGEYDDILQSIAKLLMLTEEKFGYLYNDEVYGGALPHDFGSLEVFDVHAKYVYEKLKKLGVKKLITVDPHTTNILKSVYPKIISGFDLEVKSYIEVLVDNLNKLKIVRKVNDRVVVHDSCVYARYEGIVEEPRILLKKAGYEVVEPENRGVLAICCGGPAETLYPDKALNIANKRVGELAEYGDKIVTMCPICLSNLRRSGKKVSISDLAIYLKEAFIE